MDTSVTLWNGAASVKVAPSIADTLIHTHRLPPGLRAAQLGLRLRSSTEAANTSNTLDTSGALESFDTSNMLEPSVASPSENLLPLIVVKRRRILEDVDLRSEKLLHGKPSKEESSNEELLNGIAPPLKAPRVFVLSAVTGDVRQLPADKTPEVAEEDAVPEALQSHEEEALEAFLRPARLPRRKRSEVEKPTLIQHVVYVATSRQQEPETEPFNGTLAHLEEQLEHARALKTVFQSLKQLKRTLAQIEHASTVSREFAALLTKTP